MNAHLTINTGPLRKEFDPCAAINKYAQETFPAVSEGRPHKNTGP